PPSWAHSGSRWIAAALRRRVLRSAAWRRRRAAPAARRPRCWALLSPIRSRGRARSRHSSPTFLQSMINVRARSIAATPPAVCCARRSPRSLELRARTRASLTGGRTQVSLPDAKVDTAPRTVRIASKHDSAIRHVCGTAVYVDDIREPEGTLHLAVGGAPVAHGRVTSVDLAAVRGAPGVVAVLTAADIPGRNDASPIAGDDPIFAQHTIEFHRQVVFAVVAVTRDAARRAALLGKVEVEPERPLVSVDDALDAGSQILPDYTFVKGEPAAALAASPQRLAGTLRIG